MAFRSSASLFPKNTDHSELVENLSLEELRSLFGPFVSDQCLRKLLKRRNAASRNIGNWKREFKELLEGMIVDPMSPFDEDDENTNFETFAKELVWLAETQPDFAWELMSEWVRRTDEFIEESGADFELAESYLIIVYARMIETATIVDVAEEDLIEFCAGCHEMLKSYGHRFLPELLIHIRRAYHDWTEFRAVLKKIVKSKRVKSPDFAERIAYFLG